MSGSTRRLDDLQLVAAIDRRIARGPKRGSLSCGDIDLEWSQKTIRVRHTEEDWTDLGEDGVRAIQLSRETRLKPGILSALFGKTQVWLIAALRLRGGDIIRLQAPLDDPALAEGLPDMRGAGVGTDYSTLLGLLAVARVLGAKIAEYNPEAPQGGVLPTRGEELVQVSAFATTVDAHLARILLEDAHIDCWLMDEHAVSVDPGAVFAVGGVKLLVPRSRAEDALALLGEPIPAQES